MTDKEKNFSDKLAEVAKEVEENRPKGNVDPLEGYEIEDPESRGCTEAEGDLEADKKNVVVPVLGAANPSAGVHQRGTGQTAVPPPVVGVEEPLTDKEKERKLRE